MNCSRREYYTDEFQNEKFPNDFGSKIGTLSFISPTNTVISTLSKGIKSQLTRFKE